METYTDPRVALERMRHLNKIEGAGKYVVIGSVDGEFVVRLSMQPPKPPAPELVRLKNWIRQLAYGRPNAVVRQ